MYFSKAFSYHMHLFQSYVLRNAQLTPQDSLQVPEADLETEAMLIVNTDDDTLFVTPTTSTSSLAGE